MSLRNFARIFKRKVGSVVTSSGISAGMDMTLAVIGRLYGKDVTAWLERFTEYDAHRDPAWDPFALKVGLTTAAD